MNLRTFTAVLAASLLLGVGCFLNDKADEDEDEDDDDEASQIDDGSEGELALEWVEVECDGGAWLFEAELYGSAVSLSAEVFERSDLLATVALSEGASGKWFGEAGASEVGESCSNAGSDVDVVFTAVSSSGATDELTYDEFEGGDNACNACNACSM